MKAKVLACWMALGLWLAPWGAIADDWQSFTSEDGAFSAQMPGNPDNVDGVYIWAKPNASGTGNDIRYKIYYHEPASADGTQPTYASAQAALDAIVKDDDSADFFNLSVPKTPIKLKGRAAILIDKPDSPDGVTGRSETLYILAGHGAFVMSYYATEVNFRQDYADKFFQSMQIHNPYSDPDAAATTPIASSVGTPVAVPTTKE